MEIDFFSSKKNCQLLVVDKMKSFDKNLKGDFNIKNGLASRIKSEHLKYIYTGLQIIHPNAFLNINEKVFSINKIWNKLIQNNQLYVYESNLDFLHISTLEIYKTLNIK